MFPFDDVIMVHWSSGLFIPVGTQLLADYLDTISNETFYASSYDMISSDIETATNLPKTETHVNPDEHVKSNQIMVPTHDPPSQASTARMIFTNCRIYNKTPIPTTDGTVLSVS